MRPNTPKAIQDINARQPAMRFPPDIRADTIHSAMRARGFLDAARHFHERWQAYKDCQRKYLFMFWSAQP